MLTLSILIDFARFFIVFGLAVIVHEFGHLIVAKWCGARVDVFSIGFGRKLWGVKWGETEYQVALVPVGGFVKIAGMDPTEELTGASWEFLSIAPWKRILILFAGPGMNIVLAFAIFYVLLVGLGESVTPTTTIGVVPDGSPGWEIGLQAGDSIAAVGGRKVEDWDEIGLAIYETTGDEIAFQIQRDGEILTKTYKFASVEPAAESDGDQENAAPPEVVAPPPGVHGYSISQVLEGGPADQAGLVSGAVITKVAGIPAEDIEDLRGLIATYAQVAEDGAPESLPIELEWTMPGGEVKTAELIPDVLLPAEDAIPFHPMARLGFTYGSQLGLLDFLLPQLPVLDVSPKLEPVVGTVKERSAAEKAGLRPGDRILEVDGESIDDWNVYVLKLVKKVEKRDGEYTGIPMTLRWRNEEGRVESSTITPKILEETLPTERGIATGERVPIPEAGLERRKDRRRAGILGAVPQAMVKVERTFTNMVGLLGKLVTGGASRKVFGGPIAIFRISAETGKWGLEKFFNFIAVLSASLALLNLLPIPALDGGHIVLYTYETITRRKLTLQQIEFVGRMGVFLLIPLFLFLIWNDLDRVGFFTTIGEFVMGFFAGGA